MTDKGDSIPPASQGLAPIYMAQRALVDTRIRGYAFRVPRPTKICPCDCETAIGEIFVVALVECTSWYGDHFFFRKRVFAWQHTQTAENISV